MLFTSDIWGVCITSSLWHCNGQVNSFLHEYYSFNRTCRKINGAVDCEKTARPYRLEPICHAEGRSINECWYFRQTALALYFFLSVIFFREIQEMIASGPWAYFSSKENLLQDLIMILTASFIAVAPENTEIGTHFAGWAVFFAWVSTKWFYIYTNTFLSPVIYETLINCT